MVLFEENPFKFVHWLKNAQAFRHPFSLAKDFRPTSKRTENPWLTNGVGIHPNTIEITYNLSVLEQDILGLSKSLVYFFTNILSNRFEMPCMAVESYRSRCT